MKKLIIKPHITEKSLEMSKSNKFTFVISTVARKEEIRKYLKTIFGVDAVSINTLKNAPEEKRNSKTNTKFKKGGLKKAIIKLKKGQKIDLFEVEQE